MKMPSKTWTQTVLAALAAVAVMATGSFALTDPTNDRDALTLTITPGVDFGVDVDTTTTHLDATGNGLAATLNLGATSFLVTPASVTILGDVNIQELELTASGLDTWTVDTDEAALEQDAVQIYALFTADKSSRPAEADFVTGTANQHLITGASAKVAGEPQATEGDTGNEGLFESHSIQGFGNVDNMAVGTLRQMWLRLDMPASSTVDTAQQMHVVVTAVSGTTR